MMENYCSLPSKYYGFLEKKCKYGIILAVAIYSILLCIICGYLHLAFALAYFFVFASVELYDFIICVHSMKSKNGGAKEVAKYHAAEHMVVNAYYDLGRIPTLKEVKHYSRFSINCGSQSTITRFVRLFLFSFIISISANANVFILLFLIICVFTFCIVPKTTNWCKIFQCLITSPPTNKELMLSIVALRNYQYMEDYIKSELKINPKKF